MEENEMPLEDPGHARGEILNNSSNAIEKACTHARTVGFAWLWNYATCVDKRSCAAQSEAINSLAQIYRGCEYSIIYLADLVFDLLGDAALGERLAKCRWMKNIWAIPQIIFSRTGYFFSSDWTQIGTKTSLLPLLSSIIGIDRPVLEDSECLEDYSIARRMSWASEMTAPRIEDFAYALLGLFDVSMPITYGEGHKAFFKLQDEIVKDTNDFSLLAWDDLGTQEYTGLFATSPACFLRFKTGATNPLRLNGEVHAHCAGITMEISLWNSESGLVLPLEIEDGSVFPLPLVPWDGYFVRRGGRVDRKPPGPKSVGPVRICVKRYVSAHTSRKISAHEQNVSGESLQSLETVDETSTTKGSTFSKFDYSTKGATWSIASAVETESEEASHYGSPMSSRVTSHEDLDMDHMVVSCQSRTYGNPDPFELSTGLVDEDAQQPMVPGVSIAPTCTISRKVLNDTAWLVRGDRDYQSDFKTCSASLSEAHNHTRPSWAHENTPGSRQDPEAIPIGDSEKKVSWSSCSRFVGREANGSPQMSIISNGSPPVETQVLDIAPITKELADIAAERFLSRRQARTNKRSFNLWEAESRKRIKSTDSPDQPEAVYTSDSDDGETVLIEKARFFACPFYLRNNQYTKCVRRHHVTSIEEVKEHICWDHRRPKFCPVCKEEFSSGRDRDVHIRLRTCNMSNSTTPDGITDYQQEQLEREDEPCISEESQWFQIWDIVFPGMARPPSAFYTIEREASICAFRHFWMQSGTKLVAAYLETKKCQSYSVQNEERNLQAIYDLVMDNVVDRIFDDFSNMSRKR